MRFRATLSKNRELIVRVGKWLVTLRPMRTDSHRRGRTTPPLSRRDWFTTEEVADLTGTHYRTVARWASDGLIHVSGGGHGDPWRWSEKNYREAFVLSRLRREGFSRQEIRKNMKTLAEIGHNPFSRGRFLVLERPKGRKRGTIVKIMEDGEAMELCGTGRVQLLLPFPNAPWSKA